MTDSSILRAAWLAALLCLSPLAGCADDDFELEGLWHAYQRFDQYLEGPILLDLEAGTAELAGHRAPIDADGDRWRIDFPDHIGSVTGRTTADGPVGHWIQPGPKQLGMPMATPACGISAIPYIAPSPRGILTSDAPATAPMTRDTARKPIAMTIPRGGIILVALPLPIDMDKDSETVRVLVP